MGFGRASLGALARLRRHRTGSISTVWEAQIHCTSCGEAHRLSAELNPRAFSFECPRTRERVDVPFHDPSRLVDDWREVERRSPDAVEVLNAESQGKIDL
jgi:hypothetical protein